jgi:hypothetical protein
MNILILSPNQINKYNWTHQLFRNEIGKQCKTIYYGDGYPDYNSSLTVSEIIKKYNNIDVILTYGMRYTEPFIGLGEIDIPKVHIAVDYFPNATGGTFERNHILFNRDKYDLYFGVVGRIIRDLESNGVCKKAHLLPFSIDIDIYKNLNLNKSFDIFAVFTTRDDTYPNRNKIHKMIKKMNEYSSYTNRICHEEYIRIINQSKVCITSNNKFNSLSIKYYEILSSDGFLLADKPEDFDELGFKDGKHLVIYNGLDDLKEKINFYIKNDITRNKISEKGMNFIRENHNNSIRVSQMLNIIKKEFNLK